MISNNGVDKNLFDFLERYKGQIKGIRYVKNYKGDIMVKVVCKEGAGFFKVDEMYAKSPEGRWFIENLKSVYGGKR